MYVYTRHVLQHAERSVHVPSCSLKGEAGLRIRKNALGLGLLLGGAVFSYGKSCGCKKAEILAINDDGEFWIGLQQPLQLCMPW